MKTVKAILAGTIYTPSGEIENGVIVIEGHRIARVGARDKVKIPPGAAVIDNQDRLVVPGFIDVHVHGAAGHDLMEGTAEAVAATACASASGIPTPRTRRPSAPSPPAPRTPCICSMPCVPSGTATRESSAPYWSTTGSPPN